MQSGSKYRHDLLQVLQGRGCHANGGVLVTGQDGWSEELLEAVGWKMDVQGNAVVHSQTHQLEQSRLRR